MTAPGTPFLPALLALLLAEDPNPVQPAAAELLRDPKKCVAFAEDVGRAILARDLEKDPSVYSGDAGVAIFLAGLHRATGKKEWLDAARQRLDAAFQATSDGPGLYTGRAGVGQAFLDAYRASPDETFLARARACAKELAEPTATDVISGAAGIGIFQLNLHAATKAKEDLDAARRTGEWLARRALERDGAVSWHVDLDEKSRVYTGFSHGAAGVGSFLLALHRATGEKRWLGLAEGAARFVERSAMEEGEDGWLWYRTVPPIDGEEIRVQWCHGPPGNGLFFAELVRAGKGGYRPAFARCLATTRRLGRTARVGGCQCHGVAGNAELLLEAYALTRDPALLDEARRWGSALLVARRAGFAVETEYDSSYMLGLAGIGHFFLRLADPLGTPLPLMVNR